MCDKHGNVRSVYVGAEKVIGTAMEVLTGNRRESIRRALQQIVVMIYRCFLTTFS
jgi:hypothetical protein